MIVTAVNMLILDTLYFTARLGQVCVGVVLIRLSFSQLPKTLFPGRNKTCPSSDSEAVSMKNLKGVSKATLQILSISKMFEFDSMGGGMSISKSFWKLKISELSKV